MRKNMACGKPFGPLPGNCFSVCLRVGGGAKKGEAQKTREQAVFVISLSGEGKRLQRPQAGSDSGTGSGASQTRSGRREQVSPCTGVRIDSRQRLQLSERGIETSNNRPSALSKMAGLSFAFPARTRITDTFWYL